MERLCERDSRTLLCEDPIFTTVLHSLRKDTTYTWYLQDVESVLWTVLCFMILGEKYSEESNSGLDKHKHFSKLFIAFCHVMEQYFMLVFDNHLTSIIFFIIFANHYSFQACILENETGNKTNWHIHKHEYVLIFLLRLKENMHIPIS